MTTLKFIAAAALLCTSISFAYAGKPKSINKQLASAMMFPYENTSSEAASEVQLRFSVSNDGSIKVTTIEVADEALKKYVTQKLKGLKLKGNDIAGSYAVKIKFVLLPV